MDYKQQVIDVLMKVIDSSLSVDEIENLIEVPKETKLGDYAFPTFALAKKFHKAPIEIANDLLKKLDYTLFENIQAVGPYVNFFLDKQKYSQDILNEILKKQDSYGSNNNGNSGCVPIDMSSPNIAKPISMGHLRSTVVGNSLALILQKNGFKPIKINHLGDWGTQFGKLITAYELWGSENEVERDPINKLLEYYVRFHKEAEINPELEEKARSWFKKLENKDEKAVILWEWFRSESLKSFENIYKKLGITFDYYSGEAFYNDKMDEIVEMLSQDHLLVESEGAQVVDLEKYDLNPALIKKSDGATLYMTRDLAAAFYRYREYHFVKSLYVVGSEQINHFRQLKAVLTEMKCDWADNVQHIPFGLITLNGKKLSTRSGRVVLLDDVLNEAKDLALKQIKSKNPDLKNADQVAHDVGVGAVIFHDLKNERMNSFDFNLEEVVQFEGDTGPYVQYTRVRAESILRKAKVEVNKMEKGLDSQCWELVKLLGSFPDIVKKALDRYEPSVIAKYSLKLSKLFNKYYANSKILGDENQNDKLVLVRSVSLVLKSSLGLLGVNAPDEM